MTTFTLPKTLWTKWITNYGPKPALNNDVQEWCAENLSKGCYYTVTPVYFDHNIDNVEYDITLTIPDDVEAVAFKMVWL